MIRVLLAGNPNCGKSSIFNHLTGGRASVANYPGVTVERHLGRYTFGDEEVEVLDLPGTYSLGGFSPEERVAEDELLAADEAVVVLVVDSGNLKRGLVLLVQLMQTGAKLVLALNMSDEAHAAGQRVNLPALSKLLRMPVVETVGHLGQGVQDLKHAIQKVALDGVRARRPQLGGRLDEALQALEALVDLPEVRKRLQPWYAARLLTGARLPAGVSELAVTHADIIRTIRERLELETGQDAQLHFTERSFGFVDGLLRETVLSPRRRNARELSDRVDSFLVHRVLGLPVFFLAMFVLFWLTFKVGEVPAGWLESFFAWTGGQITTHWPATLPDLLRSLLVDGLIGGVGGVLVFLPNILLLFLGLAFLEDSGYMGRAAFLMDGLMHRFGLHGKSFIPMMTGFGCSIPGIMGTRILENSKDRLTTMLVLPLVPCGARFPIWMLLIPAFLPPDARAPMLWFIYFLGFFLALLLARVLKGTVLAGEDSPFVMELPPYRLPTWRGLLARMTDRAMLYLRKAGTIILAISVVMWVAMTFPQLEKFEVDAAVASGQVAPMTEAQMQAARSAERLSYSIAGRVGHAIEPVFRPLGFDWKISTALLGAFAAKEVFVSQMGIVYSLGEVTPESEGLRAGLRRDYSTPTGLSLMLFLLIATPCMATVAVTRRESGRWSWALLQFFGLTAIAYFLSFLVYQVGSFFLA
jgi:ferrous iron transport protein B